MTKYNLNLKEVWNGKLAILEIKNEAQICQEWAY